MPPSAAGELELAPTESTRSNACTQAQLRSRTRTHTRAQRAARMVATVAMAVMLAFCLAGCRDTDVLTQKIIDSPGESPIDYTLDPVRTDNPQASQDDD